MTHEQHVILITMGYRRMKMLNRPEADVWLKPFGYMGYRVLDGEISNWYKSAQGNVECFDRKKLTDRRFLDEIKSFECYTKSDLNPNQSSSFEFAADEYLYMTQL